MNTYRNAVRFRPVLIFYIPLTLWAILVERNFLLMVAIQIVLLPLNLMARCKKCGHSIYHKNYINLIFLEPQPVCNVCGYDNENDPGV